MCPDLSVRNLMIIMVLFIYEPPRDKTNKMTVRPAKTQISLGIRPVWSESSLSAWRKLGSLATHWAHSEDSDRMGGCPGWSESSLGAHSFCWFCHEAAHIVTMIDTRNAILATGEWIPESLEGKENRLLPAWYMENNGCKVLIQVRQFWMLVFCGNTTTEAGNKPLRELTYFHDKLIWIKCCHVMIKTFPCPLCGWNR